MPKAAKMQARSAAPEPLTRQCFGYPLPVPPHRAAASSYPFTLHMVEALPWNIGRLGGKDMNVFAKDCHKRFDPNSGEASPATCCQACQNLAHNEALKGIMHRIEFGVPEGSIIQWYGFDDLMEMIRQKDERIAELMKKQGMKAKKIDREDLVNYGLGVLQNVVKDQDKCVAQLLEIEALQKEIRSYR